MAKDPVCKMEVDEKRCVYSSEYQGKRYFFCAEVCKKKFEQDPAKYAGK